MNDIDKSKEQLIRELDDLRRQFNELRMLVAGEARFKEENKFLTQQLEIEKKGFEALFNMIPGGISIAANVSCQEIRHNPTVAQFLRLESWNLFTSLAPSGNFKVMRAGKELLPEDMPIQRAAWYGEQTQGDELEFEWEDGVKKVALWNARPLRDECGVITGAVATFEDITDRKRTEEELKSYRDSLEEMVKKSGQMLTTVMESITDGFYALDSEWRFTYVNSETERFYGQREQLLGKNIWDTFPKLTHSEYYDQFLKAMNGKVSVKFETLDVYHSVWIEVRVYPTAEGIVVYFLDISERKRAEKQLRLHANILLNISDAVVACDNSNRINYWNNKAEEIFGLQASDVLNRKMEDVLNYQWSSPEEEKNAAENFYQSGVWHGVHTFVKSDGTIKYLDSSISLLKDETGPTGILSVIRDVTERKHMEKILRENEDKFRALFNNANDAIFLMVMGREDGPSEYLEVNEVMCKRLGYTREELLKMSTKDIIAREAWRKLPGIRKQIRIKGKHTFECLHVAKDGSRIPVEISSQAFMLNNKEVVLCVARDITERKLAEKALKASEERFRSAFDYAVAGMFLLSPDGNYLKVNRSFCRFIGYPEAEILKMSTADTTYSEDLAKEEELMHQLESGEIASFQIEKRFIHESGRIVWGLSGVSLVRNDEGQPLYFIGQVQDITEFKRATSELHYRVELEELITSISARFINLGPDEIDNEIKLALKQIGQFISADCAYIFQFSEDKTSMDSLYNWVSSSILDDWPEHIGIPLNSASWWYTKITNQEIVYIPSIENMPSEAGKIKEVFKAMGFKTMVNIPFVHIHNVVGFIGFAATREEQKYSEEIISLLKVMGEIILNALERKKAEVAKQLSEERFSKAFNASPSAMAIIDPDTECIIDVNKSFLTDLGFKRREVIGHTGQELKIWVHEEERRGFLRTLRLLGSIRNMELMFYAKTGEVLVGLVSAEQIYLEGHPCILIVAQNITERKMLEEEMSRLERLNLVGEMAAGVSHEIRNPMTTVRGFLQMLGSKKENAQSKEFFDLMIEELDRANAIITEFLSLGRFKKVNLEIRNLNEVVEALYPLIYADTMNADKNLKLDLGNIPEVILDQKEIRQLILNLARNGLEAMSEGGTLTISTKVDNKYVILAVHDEGDGIDPDILKKLGTPFFTTKPNGTGLGLAVCFSIAARHNAKLKIEPGPVGTTVSIRFESPSN